MSCMHPPSKALMSVFPLAVTLPHETPATVPLLVFIQVGGVHGLAQKRMFGLTLIAAVTNGMRYIMSRLIEKLLRLVSFAVSSSV